MGDESTTNFTKSNGTRCCDDSGDASLCCFSQGAADIKIKSFNGFVQGAKLSKGSLIWGGGGIGSGGEINFFQGQSS